MSAIVDNCLEVRRVSIEKLDTLWQRELLQLVEEGETPDLREIAKEAITFGIGMTMELFANSYPEIVKEGDNLKEDFFTAVNT